MHWSPRAGSWSRGKGLDRPIWRSNNHRSSTSSGRSLPRRDQGEAQPESYPTTGGNPLSASTKSSPRISCAQLWLSMLSATVHVRRMDGRMCFINTGAMVSVVRPPIHTSFQNKVDAHDPMVIVTEELNKLREAAPTPRSRPHQGLEWSVLWTCVKPC
jgi:hypothetical protein